jgi:hypothetical protein
MRCARKNSPVPTISWVSKLIKKWRITGSVPDKTRYRKKTVLTDKKLEDIRARLEISHRKSLRQLSQETDVSVGSDSKGGRTPTASKQASRHETKDEVLLHS